MPDLPLALHDLSGLQADAFGFGCLTVLIAAVEANLTTKRQETDKGRIFGL